MSVFLSSVDKTATNAFYDIEIDPAILGKRVGSTSARGSTPFLGRVEARLRLAPLLARLGYDARGVAGPLPGSRNG